MPSKLQDLLEHPNLKFVVQPDIRFCVYEIQYRFGEGFPGDREWTKVKMCHGYGDVVKCLEEVSLWYSDGYGVEVRFIKHCGKVVTVKEVALDLILEDSHPDEVTRAQKRRATLLAQWNPGECRTTLEVAEYLDINTKEAYKLCSKWEEQGSISKFGYHVKGGTEDYKPGHHGSRKKSLMWQRDDDTHVAALRINQRAATKP